MLAVLDEPVQLSSISCGTTHCTKELRLHRWSSARCGSRPTSVVNHLASFKRRRFPFSLPPVSCVPLCPRRMSDPAPYIQRALTLSELGGGAISDRGQTPAVLIQQPSSVGRLALPLRFQWPACRACSPTGCARATLRSVSHSDNRVFLFQGAVAGLGACLGEWRMKRRVE